jgi:hypothetical protein
MANDLVEEWRKFSLTEDEGPRLTVADYAMGNSRALGSHFLLGKVITERYFNKEALKTTMPKFWWVGRGITVQNIGDNLFIFQFKDEFERRHVMEGSPWLFDNYLLVLNEFDGSCLTLQIQLKHCCFWVQLHDVSLFYMTKQTGEGVGNANGKVVKVDVQENGVGWGPSLRVRLRLDITKPFPWGRLITFESFGQMWISFKYERLPWICFHYCLLGHLERDCLARLRCSSHQFTDVKPYGAWLRALENFQKALEHGRFYFS